MRRMLRASCLLAMVVLPRAPAGAQTASIARFTVHAGPHERVDVPLEVRLDGVRLQLHAGALQLYETTGGASAPVASQLEPGDPDELAWLLAGRTRSGAVRTFELRVQEARPSPPLSSRKVRVADDGQSLRVTVGEKPVLGYRYTPMPVPEGVRDIYSLSGFIHPLWSPRGEVLTAIQPPDHRHHYGIWNPWTSTEFEGRKVDFWNVGSGQGRVRAAGVLERTSGEVFGGFSSLHEHVDNTGPSGPKVALREQWRVTVWNVAPGREAWVIDFVSRLNPATDQPLTIKAYRYQGFSLRATEKWNDRNATLLTSEGLNKSNANATRARWIDVNGASSVPAGTSGVLFMTNPANFNFPEQLRIWPVGDNRGQANVYVNFNPAQDRDWVLEPGRSYALKYRMFVYDGKITAGEAQRLWIDYASPPRVDVQVLASP